MKEQRYQIKILGSIDEHWSDYFAGMAVTIEPSGWTRLIGQLPDRAALHGLLTRIRDLNLELISVQLLDEDGSTPVECRGCGRRDTPAESQQ